MTRPAPGTRRRRGRHVAPIAVGRVPIVARALVCLTLVLAGVLLVASPREEPGIVATGRPAGSQGAAVVGAGLIVLGWVPVLDLVVRGRHEVRRAAGAWPARAAPAAAVLSPVVVLLACLPGSFWHRVTAAPAAVSGGIGILLLLLVVQGWALVVLWRRVGAAPDPPAGIRLPGVGGPGRPGSGRHRPGDGTGSAGGPGVRDPGAGGPGAGGPGVGGPAGA
jgi:hypothetical protein